MKRLIGSFLCIVYIFLISNICVFADSQRLIFGAYNMNGEKQYAPQSYVYDLIIKDEIDGELLQPEEIPEKIEVPKNIDSVADTDDYFVIMDLKIGNEEQPYPEIEITDVTLSIPAATGSASMGLGKDYRLYFEAPGMSELIDVTDKIKQSFLSKVVFEIDQLGKYILIYNPKVYPVIFYLEEPIYDDEDNWINQDCIYSQTDNLAYKDNVVFPEMPKKDGYIFTGWKASRITGGGAYTILQYPEEQPLRVGWYREFFASWCPEDEYEPIVIEISSDEPITKGKEDGKKIRLTTNYGVFINDEEFPKEWRSAYESETDEQIKAEILQNWKSIWNIVGNDDIIIETAERIDDRTVELTLSGNSSDKYSNSDIYIEFDNALLMPEPYEADGEIIDWIDTKIKMDEDGVRAKMYCSDNALTLSKQNKPSSGGSLTARYTVTFDSNGGSVVSNQTVNKNTTIKEPEEPQKEGYNFAGWFTDKELTEKFDFSTKITKNITLYAKWENEENTKNQIIFTIGKKEAMVFGEEKQNDVAPVIKGDRAYLPARFVAENLGAKVLWDNETRTVIITKDDKIIIIAIDKKTAIVNDETITLDAPAFIENDRTYTPMRFIAAELGASVDYDREEQIVTITKGD